MHSNRIVAALFFLLGGSALAVTTWIIHNTGLMMAATVAGAFALAWAAIVVHVGGVVVFGLATGALIKSRQWMGAALCGLMMLGAALYSGWQIASFATAELISVTQARQAAERRENDRHKAELDAARERQKTQADLAKAQLRWLQGTVRDSESRRERKEMVEASSKLIADVGKADAPAAKQAPAAGPPVRSDALAVWLAERVGWDQATLQASPTLQLALMLILIEVMSWPLASYFWRKSPQPFVSVAEPIAPAPAVPTAPAAALLAPLRSEAPQMGGNAPVSSPPRGLPPPHVEAEASFPDKPVRPPKMLPPPRGRQPVSEAARKALEDADYPWIKPRGPLLEQKLTAEPFALWLRAFGYDGSHDIHEITRLYWQACKEFHREQLSYTALARELDNRRFGVTKKRGGPVVWVVSPFRPKKENKAPETTEQTEQRPDSEPEAEEGGVVTRPPFGVARRLTQRPEWSELGWARQRQKHMRAMRIARNRKQRGSVITGWAA